MENVAFLKIVEYEQMSDLNFKDHFSEGAAGYAAHRPTYPIELVDVLARISSDRQLALDCGCGTGQFSVLLAERFEKVIATDASTAQIENAQPHARVTYRVAFAESSGLPADCVDLITVAQAAHWLDLEKFYEEARRVARPQAAIALITYGVLHVEGVVDRPLQHFYSETIGPYWPAERRHVENGYRTLPFPFHEVPLPTLIMEVQWSLNDLMGYLNTWSAVKAAEKALASNPVDHLRNELSTAWGDPNSRRRVTWPLSIRAGLISH